MTYQIKHLLSEEVMLVLTLKAARMGFDLCATNYTETCIIEVQKQKLKVETR